MDASCSVYCMCEIILMVHGDLTVATDANLRRRLSHDKGAQISRDLRVWIRTRESEALHLKFHVRVCATRIEAAANIQRLPRQVENQGGDEHSILVVLKAGYRVAHLVHRSPVREQRQIARRIHGIRLILWVAHVIH